MVKDADSYIWKAWLLLGRSYLFFETWVVGNGEAIDFWEDKWLDSKTRLRDFVMNIHACLLHVKVRDLLNENGAGMWTSCLMFFSIQSLIGFRP